MVNKKIGKTKFNKSVHIGFDVELFRKSALALIEIICGSVLIFIPPDKMNIIVNFITKNELLEEPNDFLVNLIQNFGQNFLLSSWSFFIFYVLSHGIIKAIVFFLLWKEKLWAYPLSVTVFIGFIAYQYHKYFISHSAFLMLLTVLDVAMIILTIFWKERTCRYLSGRRYYTRRLTLRNHHMIKKYHSAAWLLRNMVRYAKILIKHLK